MTSKLFERYLEKLSSTNNPLEAMEIIISEDPDLFIELLNCFSGVYPAFESFSLENKKIITSCMVASAWATYCYLQAKKETEEIKQLEELVK